MMNWGPDRGYLPKLAKSLFIADNLEEKEAEKREFERLVLNILYLDVGRYLGGVLGSQGGARGVGAAQCEGMGPRGPHIS